MRLVQGRARERGKPTTEKLIIGGYKELTAIYKGIREALVKHYDGKIDLAILKQFATLRPHDADRIHCNLLWEAGIPIEVVAGKYLGGSEALGIMGRVWLRTDTISKYYLMLSERSPKMLQYRAQVLEYGSKLRMPNEHF